MNSNSIWFLIPVVLLLPMISAFLFARWLRGQPGIDVQKGAACWDVFIKFISALTAIVSAVFLIGKYIDEQSAARQRDDALKSAQFLREKLQFETEHFKKTQALLEEAKGVVARLASAAAPDNVLLGQFEELYWAKLIGIEDPAVEAAMVRFREKLYQRGSPDDDIHQLSLNLSIACQSELKALKEDLLQQHQRIAALAPAPAK